MHGTAPELAPTPVGMPDPEPRRRLWPRLWARRHFLLLVILPTLLTGLYYAFVAADQYESEAHLLVRASDPGVPQVAGLAQLLGGSSRAGATTAELANFLQSHDAVAQLERRVGLVERFQRPEADALSRLAGASPSAEDLLRYYRRQVDVVVDTQTGIGVVKVRSFRPDDTRAIIGGLLDAGEQRVNDMNLRVTEAVVGSARRQLAEAEVAGRQVEAELASFRRQRSDIDPQGSGEAQTQLVSELTGQLSLARSQANAVRATIGTDNPQYVALAARVAALEQQVARQDSRLVGGQGSIAAGLARFSELKVRQDFAAKRYQAAAGGLERAREEALRQQLFVTRLVEPNLPQEATHPKKLKNTATVFLLLTILYGVGWLLLSGVREHGG